MLWREIQFLQSKCLQEYLVFFWTMNFVLLISCDDHPRMTAKQYLLATNLLL